MVKQALSIIVIRQVIIHYSECEHMTKPGSLKFMSLVATSDPILAVLKPYQGCTTQTIGCGETWGLGWEFRFVLGTSLLIKV